MGYDCVIATKNRTAALEMSLPLMIRQDIPPSQIIVVDASDDHDAMRTAVESICEGLGYTAVQMVKADAANSARQRNAGLELVRAPIVMFPDDDSMWYPGYARAVLDVYAGDPKVGGVAGTAAPEPPGSLPQPTYKRGWVAAAKSAIAPYRKRLEAHLAPKPFEAIAEKYGWVAGTGSLPVITGYQMSLRTDVARKIQFDETLGYGSGYSYHEDYDVSLRVLRAGYTLMPAELAKVCHLSFPGPRGDGYGYGFCAILNCAYVCRKHIDKGNAVLERYLRYKLGLYALRAGSPYGRQVLSGALAAWRSRGKLSAAKGDMELAYKQLCDQHLRATSLGAASLRPHQVPPEA